MKTFKVIILWKMPKYRENTERENNGARKTSHNKTCMIDSSNRKNEDKKTIKIFMHMKKDEKTFPFSNKNYF